MDELTVTAMEAMALDLETLASPFTSAFAQQGIVTLLVGLDEALLVAHESYLTKNSEFFQAAMKKEWVEGQTRVIKLPDDNLATMTDYLTFTYSGDLPTSTSIKSGPAQAPTVSDWISLAKLYVLGERMLDKCMRNAIASELVRISTLPNENGVETFMPVNASNILFNGTPEWHPIRQMIVDKYVAGGGKHWLLTGTENLALLEVARALLEKVARRQSYDEFRDRQIKAEDYFV